MTTLNILRMIFMICVVFCHTETRGAEYYLAYLDTWYFYYPLLGISMFAKIATSAFFIISGMLLLSKDESVEKIYKRRVWRFFLVILIFFGIQCAYEHIIGYKDFTLRVYIDSILIHHPDLAWTYWFLLTFFGLQCMIPFLKVMAQNMNVMLFNLLIILHVVISILIPGLATLYYGHTIVMSEFIYFPVVHGARDAIFYFLLGFGLEYVWPRPSKKTLWHLFFAAIASLSIASGLYTFTLHNGYTDVNIGGVDVINRQTFTYMGSAFPTIALYCIIRHWVTNSNYLSGEGSKDKNITKILAWCGSRIFPVMLLENIFRAWLEPVYTLNQYGIPLIGCSVIVSIIAVFMGVMIGAVTKKIPYIRRLL